MVTPGGKRAALSATRMPGWTIVDANPREVESIDGIHVSVTNTGNIALCHGTLLCHIELRDKRIGQLGGILSSLFSYISVLYSSNIQAFTLILWGSGKILSTCCKKYFSKVYRIARASFQYEPLDTVLYLCYSSPLSRGYRVTEDADQPTRQVLVEMRCRKLGP